MNLREFQQYVPSTMNDLGSRLNNEVHMIEGMGSEVLSELTRAILKKDSVNIAEELGDVEWFACNYANIWGIELPESVFTDMNNTEEFFGIPDGSASSLQLLSIAVGELMDINKREFAYGKATYNKKPVELATRERLLHIVFGCIEDISDIFNFDVRDSRDAIKRKLDARYKGAGFTQDSALNRDTDAERKALEGGAQ